MRAFVVPEKDFEKRENHLIYQASLNYEDLTKETLEIPHPKGTISVKIPEDFDSTKPLRVKTKGYQTESLGDLIIYLNVKFKRKKK